MNKVIIVTGASTGIGKEITLLLAKKGHKVYALARRIELMEEFKKYGITPLKVDITEKKQIQQAIEFILNEQKHIDILINNAGYGYYDALEIGSIEQAKALFEVNLFGLMEITAAVLPSMRSQHFGKIINISSVVGKVSFPFMGWYSASKHAVEGLSDALRIELAPFGITVSIIEPGRVQSEFSQIAFEKSNIITDSPYKKYLQSFKKIVDTNPLPVDTPLSIANTVLHIINSKKPKTRYIPNIDGKIAIFFKKIFGDEFIDWFINTRMK